MKTRTKKPHAIVVLPDGREHHFGSLLGRGADNTKTAKSKRPTVYLSMWPERVPGHRELGNVCTDATRGPTGCATFCDSISGRSLGESPIGQNIRDGMMARRVLYFMDRVRFLSMYHYELPVSLAWAGKQRRRLTARLNVFSDIEWEKRHPEMILDYPRVQFYDYTKHPDRFRRFLVDPTWPGNYHLVFSQSEKNEAECREFLALGGTVASVFDVKYDHSRGTKQPLPETHLGHPVIDGDCHDRRYEDPRGVVVGLRAKGRARGRSHRPGGFVILSGLGA